MHGYTAPLQDMRFVMRELAGFDRISQLPGCEEATPDLADAILEEAAKFAQGVLAPLNRVGDQQGCKWSPEGVTTPDGWKDAYNQYCEGGWSTLVAPTEHGGQHLPKALSTPVSEMWQTSNMAFSLGPLLGNGAIEALCVGGSEELKATYLPKMISGEWAGTMNLTEPQAGSDLALLRARAEPQGDGTYKIFGQKIFITYGEHDLTDNIVHLVLARTPDAPPGVKGISLFVVPKFLVNADGSLGERNDVRCVSIEHKLGIHGSPTAVLAYGDNGGAIGYLVGQENRGLEYMFVMMNEARFGVGLQGVSLGERAYQQAVTYARDRVQGRDALGGAAGSVPIIKHPDVRRLLMTMRSRVEAARALAYVTAALIDVAARHPDADERKKNQAVVDLLIPILKGWSSEMGIEVASLGIQVHGGMGFIEETGAAQHLRDARIITIYEGTTGIQANDLIGRKLLRDGGATMIAVGEQMKATAAELAAAGDDDLVAIGARFVDGLKALQEASTWVLMNARENMAAVLAGAEPYLRLCGAVFGGWMMARAALAAKHNIDAGSSDPFYRAKIGTARFFADHDLALAGGWAANVTGGAKGVFALEDEMF